MNGVVVRAAVVACDAVVLDGAASRICDGSRAVGLCNDDWTTCGGGRRSTETLLGGPGDDDAAVGCGIVRHPPLSK